VLWWGEEGEEMEKKKTCPGERRENKWKRIVERKGSANGKLMVLLFLSGG